MDREEAVSIFHRHHWKTVGEKFNPPKPGLRDTKGDAAWTMRVIYGITVLTQECESCGEVRTHTTAGRTVNT